MWVPRGDGLGNRHFGHVRLDLQTGILGMELPDMGPYPTEHFDLASLWWKHELLHRRAMAILITLSQRSGLTSTAWKMASSPRRNPLRKVPREKAQFMVYCFRQALAATEDWIARLRSRQGLRFSDPAYRAMWAKLNAEAA